MKVYNNQFLLATVAELSMELYKDIVEEAAIIISEKGLERTRGCTPILRMLRSSTLLQS